MSKNQGAPNQSTWSIIQKKFIKFCGHCTLHGVYYLCNPRVWLRNIWFLTVCCSLSLCCFLSHMIWDKFIVDPTFTVVETTHYSTSDIPFPAVVICDTEPVHGPNTGNITNLLILRGYTQTQIHDFYNSFKNVKNKNYKPATYVKKMHYILEDLGFSWKKLLEIVSKFQKPCEDLILECFWRSRLHNCSEMFRSVYTVMGYCCQFDIPYFEMHASTETNYVAGVQITEALDISVSTTKVAPSGNTTDGFVQMYVFDIKDRVTLLDSAISLTSAAYFDVNVYLWAIDSSSNVKALDLHSRKCILETDGIGTITFYQGCLMSLMVKRVVNICKCLPFGYKPVQLGVEDFMVCTWDRLMCIYQEIGLVEKGVRDIISLNECYQRCDYVQYETEVEMIWNHRNLRNTSDSQCRVTVHFSETTCMKYRREVLYTWDQMLANLGGIFGLCLGGSIVSVLELVWFTIEILTTAVGGAITKRKAQPKIQGRYKNKVFIVNQSLMNEATKTIRSYDLKLKKPEKNVSEKRFKFIN